MERVRTIACGAGVQSTAMVILAGRGEIDFPVALFANVGDDSEHPATLAYSRDVLDARAELRWFTYMRSAVVVALVVSAWSAGGPIPLTSP